MRKLIFIFALSHYLLSNAQDNYGNLAKGRTLIEQNKYIEAIAYFDNIIKNDSNNYRAYLLRSKAKYAIRNYYDALKDCRTVLMFKDKLTSDDLYLAYFNSGTCYNDLKQYDTAITYFN